MGGVTPRNTTLFHTYYLAEHGRSALKGICINGGEPPNWECWGSAPFGCGVADPLETSPLAVCYYVKFGCSASKDVLINRKVPQIEERWGPPLRLGRA